VSPDKGAYGTRRTQRKALTKVNSLRSNPRFVIALHSPCALREPDRASTFEETPGRRLPLLPMRERKF
jgi:hypothetical protein